MKREEHHSALNKLIVCLAILLAIVGLLSLDFILLKIIDKDKIIMQPVSTNNHIYNTKSTEIDYECEFENIDKIFQINKANEYINEHSLCNCEVY